MPGPQKGGRASGFSGAGSTTRLLTTEQRGLTLLRCVAVVWKNRLGRAESQGVSQGTVLGRPARLLRWWVMPKSKRRPGARATNAPSHRVAPSSRRGGPSPSPGASPGRRRVRVPSQRLGWPAAWLVIVAVIFVLRLVAVIQSVPLCVFLSAVGGVLVYAVATWTRLSAPSGPSRVRQLVVVLLIVVIPALMDPSTSEVDNIPRFVVLVTAATVILGTWGTDALFGWRPRRLLSGLQWPLLGLVAWMAITTITSLMPRVSLLGAYASYDGLLLIVSLAVIASTVAEVFTLEQLPQLVRMMVVGALPVLVYGLIQLHDVFTHRVWDFAPWKSGIIDNVFSTFGNPNHLGGFLATVLPLIVVDAAVLARGRVTRVGLWMVAGVSALLLLKTAARGAWLATLIAVVVLTVGLWPVVRRWTKVIVPAALALGAVVVAAVGNEKFAGEPLSAIFSHAAGSAVSQRFGYWSAALRAALHHPVVGIGPDTYGSVYTRYQDAALFKTLGTASYVNGPHNVFLAWLAGQGFIGLIAIASLFATLLWVGARAWRVHSRLDDSRNRTAALLVAGLVAAVVAYGVQASFDTDQVGTWFEFWIIVGLLGAVGRSTWDARSLARLPLGRGVVLAGSPASNVADADLGAGWAAWVESQDRRRRRRSRQRKPPTVAVIGVGLLAALASVLVFWRVDALWRADHKLWAASRAQSSASGASRAAVATGDVLAAARINPWEPTYFQALGSAALAAYQAHPSATSASPTLEQATSYFKAAARLDPYNEDVELEYAQALIFEGEASLSGAAQIKGEALAALSRARTDNPLDPRVEALLPRAEALRG